MNYPPAVPTAATYAHPTTQPGSDPSSIADLSSDTAATYTFRFTAGERRVFRPRERDPRTGLPLTVSQHADRYRVVTEGGRRGPWNTDFAAYSREPMDMFDVPYVRRIILCWAPQSSKTQIALNCISHKVDQAPGPIMWLACDETKSNDAINKKIKPMIRASARLAELVADIDRNVTNRGALFANGASIQMAWATSAALMAQESIEVLIRDETDKFPPFAGREADPMSLSEQRVTAYPYTYKILDCSTPGFDSGIISTAMRFDADEIRDYHVPCPICGHEQRMEWEYITWPSDINDWRVIRRNRLAHYSCRSCGMKWDDRMRNEAVRRGHWIARRPCTSARPETIAYHLPAWYSPMVSLSRCAAAFLQAREDTTKEMAFVTQIKSEGYSETIEKKDEEKVLAAHVLPDLSPQTVPASAIALTCGVDSHKNYYKYTVRAWSPSPDAPETLTSYLIDYGILAADTDMDLERLIFHTRYPIQGMSADASPTMGIFRAAIDSGGGYKPDDEITENITDRVYAFCHKHRATGTVYATKGASHRQLKRIHKSTIGQLPTNPRGKVPKWARFHTLELHIIDVDRFKALIHSRLQPADDAPQRFFLHAATGIDYVRELLGEELKRDRYGRTSWQQVRANHYLDCFDPTTEILTKDGWMAVSDITESHSCATVNLETDEIEYQKPTRLIARQHDGEMVHITGRRVDIMVTPNHRMVVYKKEWDQGRKRHMFDTTPTVVQAKDLTIWDRIKCTATWRGELRKDVVIPESIKDPPRPENDMTCIRRAPSGTWRVDIRAKSLTHRKSFSTIEEAKEYRDQKKAIQNRVSQNSVAIDAADWAAFLGWYVSEGHRWRSKSNKYRRYRVILSQNSGEKQQQISELLNRLPWRWRLHANRQLVINSKQLYHALSDTGIGSHGKRIPQWIKDSDPETIQAFLSAAIAGDGWIQGAFRSYATTSKKLADDIQELFLKTGQGSNTRIRPPKPIRIRGYYSQNTVRQYHVTETKTKALHLRDFRNRPIFKIVKYDGMVYCVSVPNGTLLCRRSGRAFVAGNCEVLAAACADAEWLPSLKMLTAYFMQQQAQPGASGIPGASILPHPSRRVISPGIG